MKTENFEFCINNGATTHSSPKHLSDKNGIIPFKDHKINLSPSGRQKDLTLSYKKSINKNIKLGLKTIITDDIGHIKDRDLNTEFLLTGSVSF